MFSKRKHIQFKNKSNRKRIFIFVLFILTFSFLFLYSRISTHVHDDQQIVSNLSDNLPISEFEVNRIKLHLYNIDVKNGLAFIEHSNDNIMIFDVSNPKAPRVKSIIAIPQLAHFVADNERLYTFSHHSEEQTTLQVFDITSPEKPFEVKSYNLTEKGYSVDAFVFDSSLFVALTNDTKNREEQFYLSYNKINLATPISEIEIYKKYGLNDTNNYYQRTAVDIFCFEDSAFLAIEHNGLVHFNLSDNSIVNEYFNTSLSPMEITIYENYLFLSEDTFGLRIFDYKNFSNLTQIGSYYETKGFGSFCIADDYLYASYKKGGIRILDISDKTAPLKISEINYKLTSKFLELPYYPDYAKGVFIQGNFLLIGEDLNDLLIYDVSNPLIPVQVKLNYQLVYWSLLAIIVIIGIFFGLDYFITKRKQPKIEESEIKQYNEQDLEVEEKITDVIVTKEHNQTLLKYLRVCFILFLAQNVNAIIFLTINFFISKTQELTEPYYFISIPLILDIIVGVTFIIAMGLLYFERKNINFLVCAITWLIWIGLALFYRIYAGMPGFAKLEQIVDANNLDVNFPYGDTFWISFFFVLNLAAFWFATYYTDKAINAIYQKNKIMKFTIFGTANLLIGLCAVITLLLYKDINDIMVLFWGIMFLIFVLLKVIIVPIIGGFVSFIEQGTIKIELLTKQK